MKLTILPGLIASTVITTPAVASTYKVIKIHDGDTISVVNTQDNSATKVRLVRFREIAYEIMAVIWEH